jgi:hypothetical protein
MIPADQSLRERNPQIFWKRVTLSVIAATLAICATGGYLAKVRFFGTGQVDKLSSSMISAVTPIEGGWCRVTFSTPRISLDLPSQPVAVPWDTKTGDPNLPKMIRAAGALASSDAKTETGIMIFELTGLGSSSLRQQSQLQNLARTFGQSKTTATIVEVQGQPAKSVAVRVDSTSGTDYFAIYLQHDGCLFAIRARDRSNASQSGIQFDRIVRSIQLD